MRIRPVIVDTNVALVANERASQADAKCQAACLEALESIMAGQQLVLDSVGLILNEYLAQRPHGFPQGPGDLFILWAYDNQANPEFVRVVAITPIRHDARGFLEFPADSGLGGFDPPDRKFVAAAVACGDRPPILNATDNDWCEHLQSLIRNGITVRFLCPQLMRDSACV